MGGEYKVPSHLSLEAVDILKRMLNTNPDERYTTERIRSHTWFRKHTTKDWKSAENEKITIDESNLQELVNYGMDLDQARDNILQNRHNKITATYYLQLKKRKNDPSKSPVSQDRSYMQTFRPAPPPRPAVDAQAGNPKIRKLRENQRIESTGGSSSREMDFAAKTQAVNSTKHRKDHNTSIIKPTPRTRIYASSVSPNSRRDSSVITTAGKHMPIEPDKPKSNITPRPMRKFYLGSGRQYKKRDRVKTPVSYNSDLYTTLSLSIRASPRAGTAIGITRPQKTESNEVSYKY